MTEWKYFFVDNIDENDLPNFNINEYIAKASKEFAEKVDKDIVWKLELEQLIKLFIISRDELKKRWLKQLHWVNL